MLNPHCLLCLVFFIYLLFYCNASGHLCCHYALLYLHAPELHVIQTHDGFTLFPQQSQKNAFWEHSLKSFVIFYCQKNEITNERVWDQNIFCEMDNPPATKYCSQLPFLPPIYTSQVFFPTGLPHIQYRKENNLLRFIISFVFRFLPVFCFLELIHRIEPLVGSSVYFQLKREPVKKLSQLGN